MQQRGTRFPCLVVLCLLVYIPIMGCEAKDSAEMPKTDIANIMAPPNSAAMDAAKQEDAAAVVPFQASKGSYTQGIKAPPR